MAQRILIVEDDPSQQGVLRLAFERRGFAVETADDGLSAVRMMQHQAYDLALIDYQLPEIDGLASARLTKYLLGDAKRPRLIAVTGQADALTAQDGHGNTFDA